MTSIVLASKCKNNEISSALNPAKRAGGGALSFLKKCKNLKFAKIINFLSPSSHLNSSKLSNSLDQAPSNERFIFHIFSDKLSAKALSKLDKFAHKLSEIAPCEVKSYIVDESDFKEQSTWRGNLLTYYRLKMHELLPPSVERLLYLDVDMLVCDDLRGLFSLDLQGQIAGVVADVFPTQRVLKHRTNSALDIIIEKQNYFNAGFLLVDLQKFRQEQIGERALEILKDYKDFFADQDCLNAVLQGKTLRLDLKFNFQLSRLKAFREPKNFKDTSENYEINCTKTEFQNALKEPKIIHFVNYKPWREPDKWRIYYILGKFLPLSRLKKNVRCNYNIAKTHHLYKQIAHQTPILNTELEKVLKI